MSSTSLVVLLAGVTPPPVVLLGVLMNLSYSRMALRESGLWYDRWPAHEDGLLQFVYSDFEVIEDVWP